MIFNDEKKGTLTKRDINNPELTLPGATYAVYTTKPLEEILNNRIKVIEGAQLWDCREYGLCMGMKYVEKIIVNRGTETIKSNAFDSREEPDLLNDFYISKYVKNIEQYAFFYSFRSFI